MKNPAQLIVFFGSDGSGKSSLADRIEKHCKDQGIITRRYHWRPRLLPSLRNKEYTESTVSRPDELPQRSGVASFLLYVYFYLDFVFGYFFKLRPELANGSVIIYERYYYDILFHPKRYKLLSIPFIARVLTRLTPRPDLIVFLNGEPSIIRSRKPELTVDEIERQQELMKNNLPSFGKVLSIDVTTLRPDLCAEKVLYAMSCVDSCDGL